MKRYVRLYTHEWLDGSIRVDLNSAERGVWADFITLSGVSRREGYIERSAGIPYSDRELASRLNVPLKLLQSTVAKCLIEGRLKIIEGTYVTTNWKKFQAEQQDDTIKDAKRQDIPMSPEDKEASQQAAAARLGYLQPGAAKRGIKHRAVHEEVRKHNKKLGKGPVVT